MNDETLRRLFSKDATLVTTTGAETVLSGPSLLLAAVLDTEKDAPHYAKMGCVSRDGLYMLYGISGLTGIYKKQQLYGVPGLDARGAENIAMFGNLTDDGGIDTIKKLYQACVGSVDFFYIPLTLVYGNPLKQPRHANGILVSKSKGTYFRIEPQYNEAGLEDVKIDEGIRRALNEIGAKDFTRVELNETCPQAITDDQNCLFWTAYTAREILRNIYKNQDPNTTLAQLNKLDKSKLESEIKTFKEQAWTSTMKLLAKNGVTWKEYEATKKTGGRRRTRRRKGGAPWREGADTCVFKPAVRCEGEPMRRPGTVSRILRIDDGKHDIKVENILRDNFPKLVNTGYITVHTKACAPDYESEDNTQGELKQGSTYGCSKLGMPTQNPGTVLGVVKDHVNLITPERGQTLHALIKTPDGQKHLLKSIRILVDVSVLLIPDNGPWVIHTDCHFGNVLLTSIRGGPVIPSLADWGRAMVIDNPHDIQSVRQGVVEWAKEMKLVPQDHVISRDTGKLIYSTLDQTYGDRFFAQFPKALYWLFLDLFTNNPALQQRAVATLRMWLPLVLGGQFILFFTGKDKYDEFILTTLTNYEPKNQFETFNWSREMLDIGKKATLEQFNEWKIKSGVLDPRVAPLPAAAPAPAPAPPPVPPPVDEIPMPQVLDKDRYYGPPFIPSPPVAAPPRDDDDARLPPFIPSPVQLPVAPPAVPFVPPPQVPVPDAQPSFFQRLFGKPAKVAPVGGMYWPLKYHRGLTQRQNLQRKRSATRRTKMSFKDPKAYVPFKTDKGVKTRRSSYTERFHKKHPDAKTLPEIAKATGISKSILQDVYDRGMAAWRTGHRPGASQHAWGMARVHSFVLKGKTWRTADSDLARKV